MADHNYFANLIWQIADLLRRFDCVLASSKAKVLAEHARRKGGRVEGEALHRQLNMAAYQRFHNHSPLDFEKHFVSYIKGFSRNVRDFFEFENEIERMREANPAASSAGPS